MDIGDEALPIVWPAACSKGCSNLLRLEEAGCMSGAHRPDLADTRLLALELHVARRIRLRRQQTGLTVMQVAERLGMSHQQVHKCETGSSRITAGQLGRLAVDCSS